MNPSFFNSPLRILAVAGSTIMLASAQTQDDPFAAAAAPQPKLTSFALASNPLREAVKLLQTQLAKERMDPINVVFDADAEEVLVPDLRFGAVTGHDALKLLAAAAGCEAQPIRSDESGPSSRIIGYKLIHSRPHAVNVTGLGADQYGVGPPNFASEPGDGSRSGKAPGIRPTGNPSADDDAVASQLESGYQNAVAFLGGTRRPIHPASHVRVYALGTIVPTGAEIGEIEGLVQSVLETSAISKDEVRLMVHEKSNVLVVRAPDEAQQLVGQVLQSLAKNSAHTQETRSKNLAYNLENLEHELSARAAQNEILEQRLAAHAEETAQLRQELTRLQTELAAERQKQK
ncbi:MAG TPA: hypothetical protein VMN36_03725 [Verrucomicrobiales bacterium]|nr:hypothetical protein [Verrucomicrobiales bacterium]